MKANVFVATVTVVLMLGASAAIAAPEHNKPAAGNQPAATQSAPAESPEASGHDAQTSKPETGPNAGQTQGKASDQYKDAIKKDKK